MKKAILLISVLFCSICCFAQQIERISPQEITDNKTPRAIAYNFVTSIIQEDYAKTMELMSLEYFFQLMPALMGEGIPPDVLFSPQYTHTVVDMRPVVKLGYEVVVTDNQVLDPDQYFDKDSKYRAAPAYIITFNCVDTNNKFYDGSKGRYDTDANVLIVKEDEEWKVYGMK